MTRAPGSAGPRRGAAGAALAADRSPSDEPESRVGRSLDEPVDRRRAAEVRRTPILVGVAVRSPSCWRPAAGGGAASPTPTRRTGPGRSPREWRRRTHPSHFRPTATHVLIRVLDSGDLAVEQWVRHADGMGTLMLAPPDGIRVARPLGGRRLPAGRGTDLAGRRDGDLDPGGRDAVPALPAVRGARAQRRRPRAGAGDLGDVRGGARLTDGRLRRRHRAVAGVHAARRRRPARAVRCGRRREGMAGGPPGRPGRRPGDGPARPHARVEVAAISGPGHAPGRG